MRPATKKLLGVSAAVAVLLFVGWLLRAAPAQQPGVFAAVASLDEPKEAPPAYKSGAPPKALAARAPISPAPSAGLPVSGLHDGGAAHASNPALFGKVVGLVQSFALGEALAKNAADADAYVDKLCEEHRKLGEKNPLRDLPKRQRDAAFFLAPLIDYEAPLDKPVGRLHLPDELRQRIASYGPDWPTRIDARDAAGLDFSWMSALAQFDHWSVLAAGRLRDVPPGNAYREPIPNYIGLQVWSKLRLAMALRDGDVLSASNEVRHLADLIRSQQLLIGEMVGLAIYRIDAHARTYAKAAGASIDDWPEAEGEQFNRYRATSFSSIYFAYPGVKPETLKRAMECTPAPCSALLEGAVASRSFGHYGATDNLPLIQELSANKGCDADLLARAVASQEVPVADALEGISEEMANRIPKHLGIQPH